MRTPEQAPLSTPDYRPAEQFSDTTRGLCSAAYVDIDYANAVIGEVVESERKAVPPSFGFDLDPVVRHCLRARRLLILRCALVTVVLMAGFVLSGALTLAWLGLCVVVEMLRAPSGSRLRVLWIGALTVVILGFVTLVMALTALFVISRLTPDWLTARLADVASASSTSALSDLLAGGLLGAALLTTLLPPAAMVAAVFLSRWHVYKVIFGELAPGARARAEPLNNGRVERRLATVARMQRGNIAVHDSDPYAGSGGAIEHSWSFAVTLKPRVAEQNGHRIALDPHELNQRVNAAVLALRDTTLRAGERIPNVYTVPYVAADGTRRGDDPLIDPETGTPYTQASAETIAAIEACPQGGLRHYLRVVVPANGKEIRTVDGRPILPAQDSGVSVTAFVHLAVEGGLLYTEFVALVQPPLRAEYRIADVLRADRVTSLAWGDTFRQFIGDNLYGPWRLVRVGWDAMRLSSRMTRSAAAAQELRYYDYGARFSVRDRASRETRKFMQKLDGTKYIKLLDKTVTEAVIGYLREQGVDTSEFEANVTNQTFGDLIFNGGVQNLGGRNLILQTNIAAKSGA
ncbi:hypothetical protein [Actinoplanes regularis]|uniref:Uncharacterized protein n=1 Tax=Actinoplanes regularis TaxID=52697 RepID=A0A239F6X1_9ACTN|nr:hypothetical protein [Actinoplanes regularis]GIE90008.1 hypothetical protein Are01nite_64880 [Actinoplanes regularis]SNS52679.1 hypothetical protein SAMN06264365_117119 [Actinoplanes regularis]